MKNKNLTMEIENIRSSRTQVDETTRNIFTLEEFELSHDEMDFLLDEDEWGITESADNGDFKINQLNID
jgi:ribonuclease BN (tRNA processing enzyme)